MKRLLILVISLCVRTFDLVAGAFQRRRRAVRRTGVVLYYHAIKPHQRQRFAEQMDRVSTLAVPFAAGSPQTMRAARNVAVTFDDGFRSVVDNAVPELAQRGIPFTVFVPSGCLGDRPSWIASPQHPSWNETVLSAEELRALAGHPLATVGSHSITHPDLGRVDAERARRELAESKDALQESSGVTIDLFSFPHGVHSPQLIGLARNAGYRRVFTVEPALVDEDGTQFVVGRVAVDPDDWPIEFRLKLAGAYRWKQLLHREWRTA